MEFSWCQSALTVTLVIYDSPGGYSVFQSFCLHGTPELCMLSVVVALGIEYKDNAFCLLHLSIYWLLKTFEDHKFFRSLLVIS